jgi:hypothetical protein
MSNAEPSDQQRSLLEVVVVGVTMFVLLVAFIAIAWLLMVGWIQSAIPLTPCVNGTPGWVGSAFFVVPYVVAAFIGARLVRALLAAMDNSSLEQSVTVSAVVVTALPILLIATGAAACA